VTSHDSKADSIKTHNSSDLVPEYGSGSPLPRQKYLLDSFVNANESAHLMDAHSVGGILLLPS